LDDFIGVDFVVVCRDLQDPARQADCLARCRHRLSDHRDLVHDRQVSIGLYIGSSGVASGYGAAGALLILLLWVYYSAQIFLLGAEYTRAYAEAHGSRAANR
jgi:hypothetical protein